MITCIKCKTEKRDREYRVKKGSSNVYGDTCSYCRYVSLEEQAAIAVRAKSNTINKMLGVYTPPVWNVREGGDSHKQIRSIGT